MTAHTSHLQLSAIHKAKKISDIIVETNPLSLIDLYTNLHDPQTFESIGEQLWPASEQKPSRVKFVRTVIYMALQQVLDQKTIDHINTFRNKYFSTQLRDTIKHNGGEKIVEKIRFLAGKANWKNNAEKLRKLYKQRVEEKGFAVWYPDEISFLDAMLQDPSFYHTSGGNRGAPDYTKIIPLLNQHFHDGINVRNARGVSNFLYKRARSNRTEQELDYLSLVKDNADLQLIASYLNQLCHDGISIRTPQSIAFILTKIKKENNKKKELGIV